MGIAAVGTDYAHARPTRDMFTRHGLTFACRYVLDDARDQGKALKLPEAQQLSAWGIDIVANFEYATQPNLTFGQGVADARTAAAELRAMGAPRRVVYFSMDEDLSIGQIPGVLLYAAGASTVIGKENVGLYGEYDLIEAAARAGYRWLWQCYAWSRGLWSAHATVRQVKNGAFPGEFDGDLNHAMVPDFGQWTLRPEGIDVELTDSMKDYLGFETNVGKVLASVLNYSRSTNERAGKALDLMGNVVDAIAADAGRDVEQSAELARIREEITKIQGGDPELLAQRILELVRPEMRDDVIEALQRLRVIVADPPA